MFSWTHYFSPLSSQPKPTLTRRLRTVGFSLIAFGGLMIGTVSSVKAQDKDPLIDDEIKPAEVKVPVRPIVQPPIAINFRERPKVMVDSKRLKKTISVDGVIADNKWDTFYNTTAGAVKGAILCNWDDDYLYLGVRADGQSNVVFDIDAGADGWLKGADNLEIVVEQLPNATVPKVSVHLLDATSNKDTPVWNDTAYDPKKILVSVKLVNNVQYIELAIPKEMGSMLLRDGVTMGIRGELFPLSTLPFTPTQPYEPHLLLEATLVSSHIISAPGINPTLSITDDKCAAGQELSATLRLLNQTDQPVPIKSVKWEGIGNSVNVLNSVREVAVPGLPPTKARDLKYKTRLPEKLSPGTYTIAVTVDLENGKQVYSTRTFTVVEPLQVRIFGDPDPVAIIGTTKYDAVLDITSAVPSYLKAEAEIMVMPSGWTLEGKKRRGVEVIGEDRRKLFRFRFKLPSTTAAGNYPIEAMLTYKERTWTVRYVARVVRTDAPTITPPTGN